MKRRNWTNEIQQIKLQIQKDGFVTSGIITRLSAVENRLNLGLGKLNANTKVFEISAKNERLFNPLVVKKLPALG